MDFQKVKNLIASLKVVKTRAAVSAAVLSYVQTLGFEYSTYDLIRPPQKQAPLHLTNYPSEFIDHYIASRYARFDIMVNYAATTLLPFSWSEALRVIEINKDQRRVRDEGAECGLRSVGVVPIHGPGTVKAYFSFSNTMRYEEFDKLFAARRFELQLIAPYTHERILDLNSPASPDTYARLTSRETEVMTWVAQGKSSHDIGEILGIAESTVKDHLQAIFRKFDVRSKTHAAAIATSRGIVSL